MIPPSEGPCHPQKNLKGKAVKELDGEKAKTYKTMVLVPENEAVAGELEGSLGKFVVVEGHSLKGPNIYMRPVFEVNAVHSVEVPLQSTQAEASD